MERIRRKGLKRNRLLTALFKPKATLSVSKQSRAEEFSKNLGHGDTGCVRILITSLVESYDNSRQL
jgi:hypothetical protein